MKQLGFIGLGAMGKPMARNLMQAGYALNVLTRTRSKSEDLVAAGAVWCNTPKEIAQKSEAVITMLPDTPDVEQVIAGKEGVFEGVRPGMLIIDMSTISPIAARQLAQKAKNIRMRFFGCAGQRWGHWRAERHPFDHGRGRRIRFSARLAHFPSDGENDFAHGRLGCRPSDQSRQSNSCGDQHGSDVRSLGLCRQSRGGPGQSAASADGGAAYSRSLEFHGQRILERNFKPGFRLRLHRKDLDIAMAVGKEFGIVLPVTAQVREMMTATLNAGQGDWDNSSLVTLLERLTNQPVAQANALDEQA